VPARSFLPLGCAVIVVLTSLTERTANAQGRPIALAVTRTAAEDMRAWDEQVDQMIRRRDLRVRESQPDALVPNRQHQRLDQYYQGVRIAGGDLTRQLAGDGTVSIFGTIHSAVDIGMTPTLSAEDARLAINAAVNGQSFGAGVELVVLPLSDGYHLAYFGQAATSLEIMNVFVDASSGALLRQYSDFISEVGAGTGTYGDNKKVSTTPVAGTFVADDKLRPTEITTFDAKGNFTRAQALIMGQTPSIADIASSASNTWTDGTVVDAHAYAGLYYDYLFKRFGRHGLDGHDLRIDLLTHPVSLADISTAPPNVLGLYYINAFYSRTAGPNAQGLMVFGEGAPRGFLAPNVEVKPFSAAFDVVAHELTHGVTGNSAGLNGFPLSEAGALNEGFSDIFGVSTAFFYEPVGSGPMQASYLTGKDLTVPSGLFSRSLSNPAQTNDPDHYTRRIIGGDPHYNSTILSHAFYLAIEGGSNRTSGLAVQGVGAGNREQIEKAFFRALTVLLPSNATFALTRAATIQAARDLYGTGGAVERAITQAWDAVGVQPRTTPTAAIVAIPITPAQCPAIPQPTWGLYVTASAGTSNLLVNQWQLDTFDAAGVRLTTVSLPPIAAFASQFNLCGPGSSRLLAQTDACAAPCISLGAGRTSGSIQASFTATDDANQTVTFSTPRVTLSR
jgi:Zn-dependent metalloprotease